MRTIVSINAIRTDPRCQSRAGLDPGLIHEYGEHIREGAALPPLSTIADDGEYYLYDGFHRLAAYREAGATAVDVEAVPGDIWDAIERSCAVNTTHGKRRTPAETKRAVETILKVMTHRGVRWSHQEIADRCALSRPRVTQLLPELSCKYLQDSVPTTVSRNGTTFEMNTSNIGKRSEPIVLDPGPDLGDDDVDDDVDDDYPEVPYEVVDMSSGEIVAERRRRAPTSNEERARMVAIGMVRANGHTFSRNVANAILEITGA